MDGSNIIQHAKYAQAYGHRASPCSPPYQGLTPSLALMDGRNRLELKENADTGVYVKDLTSFVVKSAQEIDNVMQVRACLPHPCHHLTPRAMPR